MLIDLVTVELHHRSGLTRDSAVNSFVVSSETDIDSAHFGDIEASIQTFYNTNVVSTSNNIATFLSPALSRTVKPTFRHYNLDGHLSGSAHGSPVRTVDAANVLAAAAAGNAPLPSECAICLSFAADFGSDVEFAPGVRPRQRDRGRVFLGPLNAVVITEDTTTHYAKLGSSILDTIGMAGTRLRDDLTGFGLTWSVWSRKNASIKPVTSCSVDNAFDTQRRRGERPTLRTPYV